MFAHFLQTNYYEYAMHMKTHERELIEKFIRKVPIFQNTSERCLEQITSNFSLLHAKKDQYIVYQTETSMELYIVLNGKVRVTLTSEEGEEYILAHLCEGDFFGEMSLIDEHPRSANVVADEDATLGVLKRGMFLQTIKDDPMIAIDLLASLVKRLRQADETIAFFAFLDVRERLLKLFEHLIETEGRKDKGGWYAIKKRTHKELATRIGASREAISKILKMLISQQMIREKDGQFLISPALYEEGKKIQKLH
jgi:CRP/FNR family cyclic AMP-dependent transcriptional regulator